MYKLVVGSMAVIMMLSACGMKPISTSYYEAPKAKAKVPIKQVIKEKPRASPRLRTMTPTLPKHQLYSIHEYARFMYESDCEELRFRKDALYARDIKQYALDTIDALDKIQTNIQKYHCR